MKNKLPEGWREVELGEVLDYEQPTDYIVNSEEYSDENKTPVLTAGKSFILGYTDEKEGVYTKLPVIIFDDFTTASKFVTFPFKVKSSAMKLLRPKNKYTDLKFIFWLMQTIKSDSITHKRYYLSKYQYIKIPHPPIKTQQKIVSILEKAEKLKHKREQADNLTKEYLQSVFYEIFGDPNPKSSKLQTVNLGELAHLTMGGTPNTQIPEYYENGSINWMKSGDIKGDFIYSVPNRITELGLKNSNTEIYPKETVVIALNGQGRTRATTGILKIETTSNQSVAGIIINKKKILSEYLHFNLKFRYLELRHLTGDNDRSGLNLTILRNFPIPLPPFPLQQKFAKIVEKAEKLKEKQKQSKEKIDEMFNSLMQKAFRGELTK